MKSKFWRQRNRLWHINPNCHWCGCKTVLLPKEGRPRYEPMPKNAATIDHLYHKWDQRRKRSHPVDEPRHVLACWACNGERGKLDQQARKSLHQLINHSWPIGKATVRLAEAVYNTAMNGTGKIVIGDEDGIK